MSISRARPSGIFSPSRSAHPAFEAFICDLPPALPGAGYQRRPHSTENKKPTDGFFTEGGLGSLGSISALLCVLPTHRRNCRATTDACAELFFLLHFDI